MNSKYNCYVCGKTITDAMMGCGVGSSQRFAHPDCYNKLKTVDTTDCNISTIAKAIHENAVAHGWWDTERNIPTMLCLIHSEVSEALEAHRDNDPDNLAEELADIVIRVFDMAEGLGIDISKEIQQKHAINKTREYRHGGKLC